MNFIRNNTALKKAILGMFVLCIFLTPIAITFSPSPFDEAAPLSFAIEPTIALAQVSEALTFLNAPITYITTWIGNLFLSLASAFTYTGGLLLSYATENLVFGMGSWIATDDGFGNAIDISWKIIRDICNLVFIFGFVYTGIRTIIDPENAETKRFVSRIIIGALLINFSLFFVKIVIDFSNFTAFQIYTNMTAGSGGLAAKIADTLGIISWYQAPQPELFADITGGGMFWFFILAGILLLVAAFVFIAGAIMLISRFVTLVFIMVASPLLFAATIFPQTEHYASDLWHKLLSSSFFAPLYFLLILISIRLLDGIPLKNIKTGNGFVEALTNQTGGQDAAIGSFDMMLFFAIAVFFLMGSLILAKSMGLAGSEIVIKRAKQAMGATTAGLAARFARATVGSYAHRKSEDEGLKERAATSWIARRQLQVARAAADTSFDARKVNGVGNAMGVGEGRKGGYTSVLKEVKKREEDYGKSLGEVDDTDARVRQRKEEMEYGRKSAERHKEDLTKMRKDRELLQEELKKATNPVDQMLIKKDIKDLDDNIAHQKEKIHHSEEDNEKAKTKYEQEKMRRQTGSTFARPVGPDAAIIEAEIGRQEKLIDDEKKKITAQWDTFMGALANRTLDKDQEDAQRSLLQQRMDAFEDTKKAHETYLNQNIERGYAGILENSTKINSWVEGRLVSQNREAGKAIRKARKKGKPKDSSDHGSHAPAPAHAPSAPASSGGGGHGGNAPHGGGGGHGHP